MRISSLYLMLVISCLSMNTILAQDSKADTKITYETAFKLLGNKESHMTWELSLLKEDSIVVQDIQHGNRINLPIAELDYVKIKENYPSSSHNALVGAGIGLLIGAGVGILVGQLNGDDPSGGFITYSANDKSAIGAVVLGGLGGVLGGVLGSLKNHSIIKIPINGKKNNYQEQKEKLKKYSLTN